MTYPSQTKYVLIGKETTKGTAVTADKDVGLIVTDISTSHEQVVNEHQGISSIEAQKITTGTKTPKVSFSGDFQHARLFDFIVGAASHVQTSSDWTHTFAVDQDPSSITIEHGHNSTADVVETVDGALCDSATISIELDGALQVSAEWTGIDIHAVGTSASSSVTSTLPVFPHQLVTISINGSPASEVQSASISISKSIEQAGGIGSVLPQQSHPSELKFEYTANLGFSDETYHNLFDNATTHEFDITADNGTGLGSGKRSFQITLENCELTSFSETTSVPGLTFIEISGKGTLKTLESVDNISSSNWI